MKRQRHVLGTIAFALATAMAATAVAQDPSEAPTRKPAAAAPKRAPQAPAKKAPVEKAPAEKAAPADEAAAPEGAEAEAAPEAAEGEAAEAEPAEEEASAEAETTTTPSESKASTQATTPVKNPAAVPPSYYGPPELEYIEGMNIPPGYVKDTRIRKGMVIGGAVTWGVGWVLAATAASAIVKDQENHSETYCDEFRCYEHDDDEVPGAAALYVPLVGPWIAMYTMRHDVDGGGNALLFLNGIMQVTGFSLLVAGVAAKKTVLVRDPGASVSLTVGPGNASLIGTF